MPAGPSPARYRPHPGAVAALAVICLAAVVSIPLSFPAGGGPTGFDRGIGDGIHHLLGTGRLVYDILVGPSDPYIILPVLLIGIAVRLWLRDWLGAVFLLVAPELVVAINTWLLKPVWDRQLRNYLAYPSGHTVQFVAIATALVLVAATAWIRRALAAVACVALLSAGIGMVGRGYHYPTDIIGGAAFACPATAVCWTAVSRPRQRGPHTGEPVTADHSGP
ncbi:MAG: phosphatase PAP2 family protein [Nocardia sp.]|nr:phosphatase PAP2 family protein [Nocardia sp.]